MRTGMTGANDGTGRNHPNQQRQEVAMDIGGMSVSAGQCVSGTLATNSYRSGIRVGIPFVAMRGTAAGPTLTALACQHGRELNGIEAIRRALLKINPRRLRGTAIFIPCANPMAVRMRQQDYPYEAGRYLPGATQFNLNREWPGRPDGSLYQQMAEVMWREAVGRSDVCIDLHGWTGRSASLVWGGGSRDVALVRAFGLDIHMVAERKRKNPPKHGFLGDACRAAGIHSITAELTPQCRLSEASVQAGERGILNIMKATGMLAGKPVLPQRQFELDQRSVEHQVKAEFNGLLVCDLQVPAPIKKGQCFATLVDLDDVRHVQEIVSPIDGVVFNTGSAWGEEMKESSIVDAGETVALVKTCKVRENRVP